MPLSSLRTPADRLWLEEALAHGASHWVANGTAEVQSCDLDGQPWPVTLTAGTGPQDSYVTSLRSAWVRYAADEARRLLPGPQATLATPALGLLDLAFTRGALDRAAIVGNAMVSTNLYPDWRAEAIEGMTTALARRHPDRPLALRNVCTAVHPHLPGRLQQAGWHLVPARQVYLCDPGDAQVWRHNHVKKDQRLLDDGQVEVLDPGQVRAADLPALRACFRGLFIDKHSPMNPDFTEAFFSFCRDTGWLELWMLRHAGRPCGVIGLYARHGWLTTPLIGYDTAAPQSLGLYRRLMALLLREARDRGLQLHYSSGAGQFKRQRGGQPALEYTALYHRHLHPATRWRLGLGTAALRRWAPGALARSG